MRQLRFVFLVLSFLILLAMVVSCAKPVPASPPTQTPSPTSAPPTPAPIPTPEPAPTENAALVTTLSPPTLAPAPTPEPTRTATPTLTTPPEVYQIEGESYVLPALADLEKEGASLTRNYPKAIKSVYDPSPNVGHQEIQSDLPELKELGVNTISVLPLRYNQKVWK